MTSVSPRRKWGAEQGFQGLPQFRAEPPQEQVNQIHRNCAEGLLSAMTWVGAQAGGAEDARGAMSGGGPGSSGDHQSCVEGWLPDSGLGLRRGSRELPRPGAKDQGGGKQDSRRPCSLLHLLTLVSFHFGLCPLSVQAGVAMWVWSARDWERPFLLEDRLGSVDIECMCGWSGLVGE